MNDRITPIPALDESEIEARDQFVEEIRRQMILLPKEARRDWVGKVAAIESLFDPNPGGLIRESGPNLEDTITTTWQVLTNAVAPAICTALGAWLGSRNGRKVRIKIGDIEAEAQTREDVEELLTIAGKKHQEMQERN